MDLHLPVDPNKTIDELTAEERMRLEHQALHKQHKGHETMHMEMVLILIATMIVAQICLVEWKRRHYRSYSFVTMIAMWIIPLVISLKNQWWRFIFVWLMFSCITALIGRKALQKPVDGSTPRSNGIIFPFKKNIFPFEYNSKKYFQRANTDPPITGGLVYKWFYFLYKLSCVLGIIGYVIMLCTFLGLNIFFNAKPHVWMDVGLVFVFYGLYYGVLGRDISEICADKMASHVGYYMPQGMPTRQLDSNICAVCGNKLLVAAGEEGVIEDTFKLTCGHVFHEFCIRGWCIIGKKQTCPYCKEKVDLKRMFNNPWERPHILYGQFLDWLRVLVAWQPLILFIVQGINWVLGLE